jgi:hypothetical protein
MSLVFLANFLAIFTEIIFCILSQLIDNQLNNLLKLKLNLVHFIGLFSHKSSISVDFISDDLGKPSLF